MILGRTSSKFGDGRFDCGVDGLGRGNAGGDGGVPVAGEDFEECGAELGATGVPLADEEGDGFAQRDSVAFV